jgi:SAM-dependent methyltransferase
MITWGGGYVTDVGYTSGYYREQSPRHLALACLINGVEPPDMSSEAPLTYLELGCGQGYGALVQAASNPLWQVVAIDFNPAHVASARALAAAAGIGNVQFIEADLATLAEDPQARCLPEADVVSLHGLWSWVPSPVRCGILRLLRAKVRPGGIVHVSYNALPGWQEALALQRLVREAGLRLASRSDRQVRRGMEVAQELRSAEAVHLRRSPLVATMLNHVHKLPDSYLAHEYMNEYWSPCFHADVVADFAGAKLEWVGTATLLENFRELMLTEEQRAIQDRFDDPVMRELVKDTIIPRGFRHDVFVRGARRLDPAARDAALGRVELAPLFSPGSFVFEADLPAGRASLSEAFCSSIVAALADGPRAIAELLALPNIAGNKKNPAELVGMLVGSDQALPVAPDRGARAEQSAAFNDLVVRSMPLRGALDRGMAFASARLGNGVPCQALDLFVYGRLHAGRGEPKPRDWATELSNGRDDNDLTRLTEILSKIVTKQVPIWRTLEVI